MLSASPSASGSARGGTGNSRSSRRRSEAWLVTSTVRPGAAPSSSCTSVAAGSTCSKLSSTSRAGSSPSRRAIAFDEWQVGGLLDAEDGGDRRADDAGIADRREVDEERAAELCRELARRPRARAGSCRCRPGRSASRAARPARARARPRPRAPASRPISGEGSDGKLTKTARRRAVRAVTCAREAPSRPAGCRRDRPAPPRSPRGTRPSGRPRSWRAPARRRRRSPPAARAGARSAPEPGRAGARA